MPNSDNMIVNQDEPAEKKGLWTGWIVILKSSQAEERMTDSSQCMSNKYSSLFGI